MKNSGIGLWRIHLSQLCSFLVPTRREPQMKKLTWNIAYKLDFPFASDLWESSTWQSVMRRESTSYAGRNIGAFLRRPQFELYDVLDDPLEIYNLATNPRYSEKLAKLKEKLHEFQENTGDPWIVKWQRE